MRWVRPIFTMSAKASTLAARASRRARTEGTRTWTSCSTAAMCIAVGKVSLDDCDMLTWSLGWTGVFDPMHPTGELDGPVGDDLVGVHVGLGPAARLPHPQGEVVVERARRDLGGRPGDEFGQLRVEQPELGVGAAPTRPSGSRWRGSSSAA